MKLELKKLKNLPCILQEFNWDVEFGFDKELLNGFSEEEKQIMSESNYYATRCNIENAGLKTITIDYLLPTKDQAFLGKTLNQFVTSKLIREIKLTAFNQKHKKEFTYNCVLEDKLPDWHITFGIKPDALILTVIYKISSLSIE